MLTQSLIFIGYKSFSAKDGSKTYYVINCITVPTVTQDKKSAYSKNVDIFTEKEAYEQFIDENELLDTVEVPYEIYGDKIRFTLK